MPTLGCIPGSTLTSCDSAGASTTNNTTSSIWQGWMTTCTTSTTGNALWVQWVDQYGHPQQASIPQTQTYAQGSRALQPPLTVEEEAELRRRAEEQQRQADELQKKRKEIDERAKTLLHENLTEKQREALNKNGWFLVEGGKSKKTYRIHGHSSAGNIRELSKDGKEVASYCVHSSDYTIPLNDNLLAQKLGLEFDEDHIIKTANRRQLMAA